jgi:hypothetical protein
LTEKEKKKKKNYEDSTLLRNDAASLGIGVMGYPVMWHHIPEEGVLNNITKNLRTQTCVW